MNLEQTFAGAGSAQLGLQLGSETQARLLDYVALLHKWNKVYNLTAIRDPEAHGQPSLTGQALLSCHTCGRGDGWMWVAGQACPGWFWQSRSRIGSLLCWIVNSKKPVLSQATPAK